MKLRVVSWVLGVVCAATLVGLGALAQPGDDPWWRPLSDFGQSAGVTYGTTAPLLPASGELMVDMDGGADTGPVLQLYDAVNGTWDILFSGGAGDITLTSGQFLMPNGTAALPSWSFTNDPDSGGYLIGANNLGISVGAALVMDWEATNAAGASADLTTISSTLGAMDNDDTVRGLFVDLTNADHTGAGNFVYGVNVDGIVADAQATEYAMLIGSGWDFGLSIGDVVADEIYLSASSASIRFSASGTLAFGSGQFSIPTSLLLNNFPDAVADYADTYMVGIGRGADTIAAMNGSDAYAMLEIDFTNADHTGANNSLYGIYVDGITSDADAYEYAQGIGAGWEVDLYLQGDETHSLYFQTGALWIGDGSGNARLQINDTSGGASVNAFRFVSSQAAMNGSDTHNIALVNHTNADHTGVGNQLRLIATDDITEDPDAFETGLYLGSGTDAHFTLKERGGAFADNPPAGAVAFFLDDNADWSGGGGNDCALIAQTSAGATVVVATIVLNGVCP